MLTLTLLMLGVFALVVMTSVLDGVLDKVGTGFAGMSWDGTIVVAPKSPETTRGAEAVRDEPGAALRGPPAPDRALPDGARLPAARPEALRRAGAGRHGAHLVVGVSHDYAHWMNRPIGLGRGLTADDERRRTSVAVVGATLGSKLFGGSDPVGRDVIVEGVRFRIVGVQAPGQLFSDENYYDANGILIPLRDVHGPDRPQPQARRTSR